MSRANILNTQTVTYLELVGNGKSYVVPRYQRDYSWSEEHWEDLWNDFTDLLSNSETRHYLGALVVDAHDDRELRIIDGQQRLVSLSLFSLAVISKLEAMARDGIEPRENQERALELRSRFVGEKDPASLMKRSRIQLNEIDDGFYQDYLVQLRTPRDPRRLPQSNRRLWECYRYFRDRLDDLTAIQGNGQSVASLLSDTVARQLFFILISVDEELNAYTVFETLNARGLELTTTDLLKNYLFSRVHAEADLVAVQRRWSQLVATVEYSRFPEFLRYHLLCEHPQIRSRRLFKLVREQTRDAAAVFSLLEALENRADLYSALLDATHEYWTDLPEAKEHVRELSLFRVKQPMPLLFVTQEMFAPEDFVRVLKLVGVVSFRFTVVSRLNTNELEPVYHAAAKAVATGEAKTPKHVFDQLKPIYVDDTRMRQNFLLLSMNARGQKRKLVKYILARLEEDASGKSCDPDTDAGTIEHVLPESPSEDWEGMSSSWESYVDRLGNLTLLEAPINRKVGNAAFATKLAAYCDSHYKLTARLPSIAPDDWTPERVDARQRKMADRAVHLWRADYS